MNTIKCDRCKAIRPEDHRADWERYYGDDHQGGFRNPIDLCPPCDGDFRDFLKEPRAADQGI